MILSIINLVIELCIVVYLVYKFHPIRISANSSFWCKKVYSYSLMYRTKKTEYSESYKTFLVIPIRNMKKVVKWDDKMFETGKYKQYQK